MDVKEFDDVSRQVVIANSPTLFDHEAICTLALVDKSWNGFIQKTAKQRRQYFEARMDPGIDKCKIVWHKAGSAYSYWKDGMSLKDESYYTGIHLYLIFLKNSTIGQQVLECYYSLRGENPLFRDSRSFFNERGEVCFHAYGWIKDDFFDPKSRNIIEYSLDIYGGQKKQQCFANVGPYKAFSYFKQHPLLLRALMYSHVVYEDSAKKIYGVEGIGWHDEYIENGYSFSKRVRQEIVMRCTKKNNTPLSL